jgi:hypothetical protein
LSGLLDIQELVPDGVDRATVPFGEWLPDMPELNNPGAVEALNVIPAEGGYVSFGQHTPDDLRILPEQVRGAAAVVSERDIVQLFAGTIGGVYTDIGSGFVSILSRLVSSSYAWKFIRVNEQMVALHPDIFPVRTPVNTDTAMVNVGGNPPKAECGAQVGDFLMLGNLYDDPDDFHGAFPARVRWGGFNNVDDPWVSDPATQADFQDMPAAGGAVRAISGREYGTIFQDRMISRATYRGLPEIFDIVTVEDKRGCIARDSIVDVGAVQLGIAEDGFFMWNGTNTTLLGTNKVNRYFFNKLQYGSRSRIAGAVDFVNGCAMWAFPTDSSGLLNEIIIYSYKEDKWSHSIQTLEFLFESAKSSVTLEDLTDPLETYTEPFDSDFYRNGGRSRMAAFNDSHQYGLFDGAPQAAVLDTSEATGPEGRRVFVNAVRPLVDLALPLASVQIVARDQMIGQPLIFSDPVSQEIDGQCSTIGDGRYMRFRVNIPVDAVWRHAVGVEVARKPSGVF